MRHLPPHSPFAVLNLLPFLDIIFATTGVFIVVFALQEIADKASIRQLTVDHLAICTDGQTVMLYPDPVSEPASFTAHQLPALLNTLADQPGGVHNLTFAFTGTCFNTRRRFEEEFARMTALFHERQVGKTLFRLAFQPLSMQPEAVEQLLAVWRRGSVDHGTQ